MTDFEQKIMNTVHSTVLKQIQGVRFVEYHHSNKKHIPDDVINKIWDKLDWDSIIKQVAKDLNDRMAKNIVQYMLSEVKTDTKAILSVEGVRQKIRMEAYPKLMEIINNID